MSIVQCLPQVSLVPPNIQSINFKQIIQFWHTYHLVSKKNTANTGWVAKYFWMTDWRISPVMEKNMFSGIISIKINIIDKYQLIKYGHLNNNIYGFSKTIHNIPENSKLLYWITMNRWCSIRNKIQIELRNDEMRISETWIFSYCQMLSIKEMSAHYFE